MRSWVLINTSWGESFSRFSQLFPKLGKSSKRSKNRSNKVNRVYYNIYIIIILFPFPLFPPYIMVLELFLSWGKAGKALIYVNKQSSNYGYFDKTVLILSV